MKPHRGKVTAIVFLLFAFMGTNELLEKIRDTPSFDPLHCPVQPRSWMIFFAPRKIGWIVDKVQYKRFVVSFMLKYVSQKYFFGHVCLLNLPVEDTYADQS